MIEIRCVMLMEGGASPTALAREFVRKRVSAVSSQQSGDGRGPRAEPAAAPVRRLTETGRRALALVAA